MISKTRGHPNLTPQRSPEYPLVSDTANIVQAEWRKKELVHFLSRGAAYIQAKIKYSKFPVSYQVKSGSDARKLKEMCPHCHQK